MNLEISEDVVVTESEVRWCVNGVRISVSREFFDTMLEHPEMKKIIEQLEESKDAP